MEETAAWMADGGDLRDAVAREAVITLSRNRPDDWADRVIYVWLNGARLDPIRYGATLHLSVPPGRHTVKVHNTLRGRTLEIDAAPGEHIRLSCGNQTAAGGFLMMLMMGVAALRVRLDREGEST